MSAKIWYVGEMDTHTNEVVSKDVPAENAHKDVLCIDGKKRDLWECAYSIIAKLLKSEIGAQLTFKVFYREGKYGPVRQWPFVKRKKFTLKKALEKRTVRRGFSRPAA